MTATDLVRGNLPQIIRNADGLYKGDLRHYLSVLFYKAQNVRHPYHNWRHMTHVLVMAYFACEHHKEELTPVKIRNILIAAIFHDFDHSGMLGQDDLNIARALRALDTHLLPEDREHQKEIAWLIEITEYPYKTPSDEIPLRALILRDADMAQVFSLAWMQQVIFGFASEWRKEPIDVLRGQIPFLDNVSFHTNWGQTAYPASAVQQKLQEVTELLELLDLAAPAA